MSLPEFVRPITASPDYHWFGYYDKLQFDPTNRYVLAMKVDFEHRSPTQNDWIDIGLIDLDNNLLILKMADKKPIKMKKLKMHT